MPGSVSNKRISFCPETAETHPAQGSAGIFPCRRENAPWMGVFGWKIIKKILVLGVFIFPALAVAEDAAVSVKKAELTIKEGWYVLNADISFTLNPTVKEALQNSIALTWGVRIKILKQRRYLWHKTVLDLTKHYNIRNHALLNMYQLKKQSIGRVENFSTLTGTLKALGTIRDLKLIKRGKLEGQGKYFAAVKIEFYREDLPLPLRTVSYFNPHWNLSSNWFSCPLEK